MDLLAKRLGADGQQLGAILDVSAYDPPPLPEDRSSISNYYYIYNNALLCQWQATFTGDRDEMLLYLVDGLISTGREDLLPILFKAH